MHFQTASILVALFFFHKHRSIHCIHPSLSVYSIASAYCTESTSEKKVGIISTMDFLYTHRGYRYMWVRFLMDEPSFWRHIENKKAHTPYIFNASRELIFRLKRQRGIRIWCGFLYQKCPIFFPKIVVRC